MALLIVGLVVKMKSFERHLVFFDLRWGGKGFKPHSDKTQHDIGFLGRVLEDGFCRSFFSYRDCWEERERLRKK